MPHDATTPNPAPTQAAESANSRLARALGVEPKGLRRLVLTLEAMKPPLIEATYLIRSAEGVTEAVTRLELVCGPAQDPDPATPAG